MIYLSINSVNIKSMTMLRDLIIEVLDELLVVFEDNKYVYRRIVPIRHKVRNLYNVDDVNIACKFFIIENYEGLCGKDICVFKHTWFYDDMVVIWSEMTALNKEMMWRWVENIVTMALKS